jgi:hypothetical protein
LGKKKQLNITMARSLCLLVLASLTFLPIIRGEETARARLYCLSLSLQPGEDTGTSEYSLNLDNGELWYYNSSTYAANVTLYDNWFGDTVDSGYILLPIPNTGDANQNGFPDFFESSQPVNNIGTSGSYNLQYFGTGTLQATWSRGTGSSLGSCTLNLKPNPYYTWLTFYGTFQLLEYTGPLTYTPGATTVSGRVNLVQTDAPDNLYAGPVTFVKSPSDRFNTLTLQPGSWTNAWQQTFTYTNGNYVFQRDTRWPTNYSGYVFFYYDYNPAAPYPFDAWVLSIDDPNDANHNGIPDFSDDLSGPAQPRRPRLTLARGSTNLWLSISGDVGHAHQIQELTSLSLTNWVTVWSQSLTNDPQPVSLPIPSGSAKYWRVVAQ